MKRAFAGVIHGVATVTVLLALVAADPIHARSERSESGTFMVRLQAPPTSRYAGEPVDTLQPVEAVRSGAATGKARVAFPPTSPRATGRARLDVDMQAVREYVDFLDGERAQVLAAAADRLGRELEPKHVYRHVMNGFAVELSVDEARALAELPGVVSVAPEVLHRLHTDAGPEWIGAERFWNGVGGVPNPNRGEGMVVGIIDTGINWESIFFDDMPAGQDPIQNPRPGFLGLCSRANVQCNGKIIGVYDFTDEGTDGMDPDTHGSHVASTAAGTPLSFNLDFGTSTPLSFQTSGVAPRASIISYKACQEPDDGEGSFTCPGSATTAALEQAIENQVDALNYSLGGDPRDPWLGFSSSATTTEELFLNLREAGIFAATSAGNSGPGEGTVGTPANAPWAFAVANSTHDRILANNLIGTQGGVSDPGFISGQGITDGTDVLPIVHASDFGNALCGEGPAELGPACADNTGASNPFAPGTFNGQIVVCDRGTYGRIEKGKNVLLAGAAGMILANTDEQGESINADRHCLPATHIGDEDGDAVREWLSQGSGHRGQLTGTFRTTNDDFGGLLNTSSSRGPAFDAPGVMKPNITGPGTSILAASNDGENGLAFLTGTSMSSPHAAGAGLLLRKAHPDWGPDEVITALETTADPDVVRRADGSAARVIDRGAGNIQVDRAARIGLVLPTSAAAFRNANPSLGGDPAQLNLPGIFSQDCAGECSFTRTVRALGAGTWEVQTEGALSVSVTPASFTLAENGQRTLQITVGAGAVPIGAWGAGSVRLVPSNTAFVDQVLPVGAFVTAGELPEDPAFTTQRNRGAGSLEFPSLLPIDELVLRTSPLLRPVQRTPTLIEDPTPFEPYDSNAGTQTRFFQVPADALMIHAETFVSSAPDIDLFVGRDLNGNGVAEESEEVCASQSPDDTERCRIERPDAGTWWVRVQNWEASLSGSDQVPYEYAVFAEADDPSFVVSGPGAHPGGSLTVPVYWDQPAMLRNQRWLAAVGVATAPDQVANGGVVVASVTRTGTNTPMDTALFEGQQRPVVVPAGTTHRLMFVDVPSSATSLEVDVEGEITEAFLSYRPFSDLTFDETPEAPLTPVGDEVVTGSGVRFVVDGGDLAAGRYFVVLDNRAGGERRVEVTATVTESGAAESRRGLWSPLNRAISQGLDWQRGQGGNGFGVWYSYDEQGLPTFYISGAPELAADDSFFTAPLFRVTSNNLRSSAKVVGEVQVTELAEDRIVFAWRLNGNHGAEIWDPVSPTGCPELGGTPRSLLGHWFSPTTTAGGATVLVTDTTDAWVRYYYDDRGNPRWALADGQLGSALPLASLLEVRDFRGWCIYCDEGPITSQLIGTLEWQFVDEDTLREISDFVAGDPLDASVDTDRELAPISVLPACSG
ncbi:MAG: S8 family serine peptidase [Wenzhouxiangellaceae bacterium]|nr:S8 family serine peptidase [Wenzhouxiangellaceae bacterium]